MSIRVNVKSKVGGIFESVQIIRPDGTVRRELGPFPNLITDDGLDMIGELSNWLTHLKLGTGTTPPAVSDMELENQVMMVAGGGAGGGLYSSPPYGYYASREWLTSPFVTSTILGEIGVGTADRLFSRTLIKDSEGEPTTIEVLEGEMVRVVYRFNYYAPENDATGTVMFNIDGVDTEHAFTSRACKVTSAGSWALRSSAFHRSAGFYVSGSEIRDVTDFPSNPRSSITSSMVSTIDYDYVPGSMSRIVKNTIGPTGGNLSPSQIVSIEFPFGVGCYQLQFDPPIPKDNTKTLVLELSHSWGRAE